MVSATSESTFGRYQLRELIGRGGMGQVFRAYDTETDRIVAIKVLPPHLVEDTEFQERFRREARMAASLNDPHVVPIHGFGEIDGRLYVDMRLIEGRDLVRYMADNGGRLRPDKAVAVIEQVAAALDSAHRAGLIHRDVKPSNILIAKPRDFVYLIDFGLARATTDTSLTSTGYTMGTLGYIAPERFRGTTDSRADVYALACVLYECLTGTRPFPGEGPEEQIAAHFNFPPPKPSVTWPGVPSSFDHVIARGMAKDVKARYQSPMELAHAARAALKAPRAVPANPESVDTPRKAGRRSLLLASLAGGGLALLLVAVLVAMIGSSEQATPASRSPRATSGGAASQKTDTVPIQASRMPDFARWSSFGRCEYGPIGGETRRRVKPPDDRIVDNVDPPNRSAVIHTSSGDIPVQLKNYESPCTVISFIYLANKNFFNRTRCPKLVKSHALKMLQCGDPVGDGDGGPGYTFADEYPAAQLDSFRQKVPVVYPRGTLAMTLENGSQFMLMYGDSVLTPEYTVFGSIGPDGLQVIDRIVQDAGGGPGEEVRPAVEVSSVTLD